MNHSCDPNCGIVGAVLLVAMRDIEPGDEICFDYAMTDTDDYDEFECTCGTALVSWRRDAAPTGSAPSFGSATKVGSRSTSHVALDPGA